jgi:hypothetical protein
MKRALSPAAILALGLASMPAQSRCYHVWHYHTKQPGCEVTHVAEAVSPRMPIPATPKPVQPQEAVNATPLPIPDIDDAQRAVGLEMLRQEIDREIREGSYPMFKYKGIQ